MYLNIKHILFFSFFFVINTLYSQNEYSVSYLQTDKEKTFNEIMNDGTLQFVEYKYNTTYFKANETYWIKIEFDKAIEIRDVVLLLNTPISKIEFYAYNSQNELKYNEAGISVDYQKQLIHSGDKNKFYINFLLKGNVIYLKIRNELLFKYNIDNIEIKQLNEWVLKKEKQHIFQGFYIGIIVILVIISILYKISSIKSINLFYIAYLLSNLILFLFLNEYTVEFLFKNLNRIDLCLMVSMHFASLFFIQFARNFFDLSRIFPTIDRILNYYTKICLIIIFCLLIIAYFDFPVYSYIAIVIEIFNQLIGLAILLIVFKKTNITGKLITFGAFFSTADILYILYDNHIVELTTKNLFVYQAGYLIEVLFILIAIRLRYKQVEAEQKNTLVQNAILAKENQIREQENLLLKQENDITILKTQLLKNEIDVKDKEIAVSTMQLTQKDLLLNNLHEKIKKIQPETSGQQKKELTEIIQNLNSHQKDTFWNEFEIYFEQMHNGFLSKLSEKYPALTHNDKRLCAFLKVGMTSKEIGNFTQKSYKSIEVFRSRLRKKLEIETETNLIDFLNTI